MTYKINPTYIILDFLRSNLSDVKNRITEESTNTINITDLNTVNVIGTGNISHVGDVTLNGTSLEKYKYWVYDTKNRKIVLRNISTGEITYKVYTGNNFIYPGRPKNTLSNNSFPRVTIEKVSSIGNVLGNNKSEIVTIYRYQIKTYCRRDDLVSVNYFDSLTSNYEGQELSEFINLRIYDAFDNNRSLMSPIFANYELNDKEVSEGFDNGINCYITRQDFTITHINDNYIDVSIPVEIFNLLLQNGDNFELQNGDLLEI